MNYYELKANDGKTYRVPRNPDWKSGPPPATGWWPASRRQCADTLRWWDGKRWSAPASTTYDEARAGRMAPFDASDQCIEWCARWWENQ